jgi:hypothetical protein
MITSLSPASSTRVGSEVLAAAVMNGSRTVRTTESRALSLEDGDFFPLRYISSSNQTMWDP